jgi:hypothetical protein
MKKLIFILLAISVFSCNSDKTNDAPESATDYPAVQNVNGNMPDTTNSINLGNKTDSTSGNDSLNR